MGLDTTHGCFHGSYSGFGGLREMIASMININLGSMAGFGGKGKFPSKKKEPMVILLDHSDCDGEISHKDCLPLANRMKEIRALVPETEEEFYKMFHGKSNIRVMYSRDQFLDKLDSFIEGLELAHKEKESVGFH